MTHLARLAGTRMVAAALAVGFLAAACSASASPTSSPTAATPTPTPTAVPTPAIESVAPEASVEPTTDPQESVKPLPSMTAADLALVARLPTQVLDISLGREAHDLATLNASSVGWKQFLTFANELKLDPSKVLIAYAFPDQGKEYRAKHGNASFLYGAFQFTGADVTSLPDQFIKVTLATQPGTSYTRQNVNGRDVIVIDPGEAAPQADKSYIVFVGDTVFFGGSDDTTLRDAIVASFPK